ncbi:MAG: DEAD/DEAH box helicase, partial [Planctomycetota bacterium]
MAETAAEPVQQGGKEATDRLLSLPDNLVSDKGFSECLAALAAGKVATFDSVWGSACALLVASLASKFDNVVAVVPDNKYLDNLLDDLETFHAGIIERFPASLQTGSSAKVAVDLEYGDRLRIIKSLNSGEEAGVIVADAAAMMQPVAARDSIAAHVRRLKTGESIGEDFADWLTGRGFHQTSAVELPGEFCSRAGIIDVYAWDWTGPVRIELFDDEIESLRQFDPATQRSIEVLSQIEISIPDEDGENEGRGHLADYLPADTVLIEVEPELIREAAKRYIERSSLPDELFGFPEVEKSWSRFSRATANRLAAGELDSRWQMPVDSVERFSGDIGEVRIQVERLAVDSDLIIVARVDGEIGRVREILSSTSAFQQNRIHLTTGCVHEGFRLRGKPFVESANKSAAALPPGVNNLVVIGCDQLFHRTELRRRGRRRLGKAIDSFLDLRSGDLIVHLSHGIGRFRGLKMLDKDGQMTEHLELEFYGGTRIYVPASKIDLVQKYIGGTKNRPVLAKIGGKNWLKQKAAAEDAVNDLASEMIELQATRSSRPGISFSRDTEWQHEFEQSFPYRETPDQLTAIDSIKADMQQPRPMDRLLCGDVGYGKTEVAMRAAFKAVENGYQVAMLVPTTVLAEQHYRSFKERMGEFPLDIGKLSRFCTTAEQRETIERLKVGRCDIVIGTHRLVSKDVSFYNLGLVIIDEEQRFGVEHKERLKNLRKEVDLLTMSATPIPRTLHMSLVGVRDISNLETAPED